MEIRFIDLFAGIGGFRYGLEQSSASFKCVYSNEWDKYANLVYKGHYGQCDNRDIRAVSEQDIPDHDLLTGGFPCQAFSVAGKRGGFEDTRGTLFFEIARIIKQKRPRLLLLENVKGLLSHDQGKTFTVILNTLYELGYDAQWQVINSKYHGVPQNRERLYIVGNLREKPTGKVFYIENQGRPANKTGSVAGSEAPRVIKTRFLGQNGSLLSESMTLQASEQVHIIDNSYPKRARVYTDTFPTVRNYGAGGNKMPFIYQMPRGHNKGGLKNIAPTLSSNEWHHNNVVSDGLGIRKLTPVECERLQGFPDNWTATGYCDEPISDSQRYKMLGNAVTTNVITAIGNYLAEVANG